MHRDILRLRSSITCVPPRLLDGITLSRPMPNGHDKNWIRLLGAIDGFRVRYDAWPTRVRIFSASLADIRDHLFSPELYAKLTQKLDLIANEAPMVAEDDDGNSYSYGAEGFPSKRPNPSARDWLGVEPDRGE
jgi:hypothetical protein